MNQFHLPSNTKQLWCANNYNRALVWFFGLVLVVIASFFLIISGGNSAAAATTAPAGLYFSSTSGGNLPGVGAFADEDILRYDEAANTWSLYFDGSDVGLGAKDVDAFEVLADGSLLLSLDAPATLTGVGAVADADILRFTPINTGANTAGAWSLYFDGSDVGLTTTGEDVDGIAFAPDGQLLISVFTSATVTGVTKPMDEDLLAFQMTSQGANTAGTWAMYYDGSDVGLTTTAEDVGGVWSDPATRELYLSTTGAFSVGAGAGLVKGQASDLFICAPGAFGDATSCLYRFFWDGAIHSFGPEVIDGVSRVGGAPATQTPTPTATSTHTPTPTSTFTPTPTDTFTPTPTNTPTATPPPPTVTQVCGAIGANTTWSPAGGTYLATCGITVNAGVTLTIVQGTVVKFQSASIGITVNGTLLVNGAAGAPITFTSYKDDSVGGDTNNNGSTNNPAKGDWLAITTGAAGQVQMSYANLRYGGYSTPNSLIYATSGGTINLDHTNLSDSLGYGVRVNLVSSSAQSASLAVTNSAIANNNQTGIYIYGGPSDTIPVTVENNTFSNNATRAVQIDLNPVTALSLLNNNGTGSGNSSVNLSGSLKADITLPANSGMAYWIQGLIIPAANALTIQPGAVVKLSGSVAVNGTLLVPGTDSAPVLFTSYQDDSVGGDTNNDGTATGPTKGDWSHILASDGGRIELSHTTVRYGGAGYSRGRMLYVQNGGTVVLNHANVNNSAGDGIQVDLDNATLVETASLSVSNSTIADNRFTGIFTSGASTDTITLTSQGNTFRNNPSGAMSLNLSPVTSLSLSNNSASGNGSLIQLTGTLGSNLSLPSEGIVYQPASLNIANGATLTLGAGTILKLQSVSSLSIRGSLLVQGTAANPVYFTSYKDDSVGGDTNNDGDATSPARGDWTSLSVFDGGRIELYYAQLRYGGDFPSSWISENFSLGTINLQGSTTAIIDHTTISDSFHSGISVMHDSSELETSSLTLRNSTISNGWWGVFAVRGGGEDDFTLDLQNNTFEGNGGAAVRLSLSHLLSLDTRGNTPINNGINGISLYSSGLSTDLSLPGTDMVYYAQHGFGVATGATLTLKAGSIIKLGFSSIRVEGTLLSQGSANNPVHITTLYDDSVGGDTNNDGNATSPRAGYWDYLSVTAGGHAQLSHTHVRYGGHQCTIFCEAVDHHGALDLRNNGTVVLENSSVTHSEFAGIYVLVNDAATANLTVSNTTIAGNSSSGIAISDGDQGSVNATITGSQLYNNSHYGLYYVSSHGGTLYAENNWWGSPSGPAPYGSGNAINFSRCYDNVNKVSYICQYYVDADPWIGKSYDTASQLGSTSPIARYQAWEADPVNTATGNHAYRYTDLSIPTRGLPLSFTRSYNSLLPADGPLGWGWRHTWQVSLVEDGDEATITFGDGHAEQWLWDGAQYVGRTGVFGRLTRHADGSFDLTQKDHTRYHFAPGGRLAWAEDNNGNRTSLAYDGDGRLAAVAAPDGRALTLAYSGGRLTSVTDPGGRVVQFAHDGDGNLTAVTDVRGKVTTAAYDANHRLLTLTDANDHTFVTNVFDSAGRVIEQRDGDSRKWTFVYSDADHLTIVTDPLNRATTYTYDGDGRLLSEKNALNQTESYSYDAAGNRSQVTDRRGGVTTMTYDGRGNLLTVTDPRNFVRSYTYDAADNLLTETDARGGVTTTTYNANHNPTSQTDALNKTTTFTYTAHGQPATVTDPRGGVTTYGYNANGDRTSTTDALDGEATATYDALGRLLSETDPLGRTTTYTYNAANHLLTATNAAGTTSYTYDAVGNRLTITDPRGGVRTTTYDNRDKIATETNALGHTVTYAYDAVGNLITVTDPLGHATTYGYDALNRRTTVKNALNQTTTYGYDANGNNTTLTDARGKVTTYTYDARNQLTQVKDAANGTVSYTYDGNGNRTQMTDANNHATTYVYDALNRLTSTTNPLDQTVSNGFDAVGNRTTLTKADGTVVTYTFDALNRLTGISAPGLSIVYTYDANGNRLTMTDATGTTTYAYDALDRVTSVAAPNGTLGYGYDANGNRISVTYSGGTATYVYDLANRLTTVTDWGSRVTTYSYDAAGRQTGIAYPNGAAATYTYDNADRLLSLTHSHVTHGTLATVTYTLDAVGNRLTMVDGDGTTTYTYDNLNRLTRVVYPGGEQVDYTYDPMGNRLTMTSSASGATAYTYDDADRLLTAGATTYAWDANGNMTGKGGATYTWDALDRLTGISGATTAIYAYNGDGVRVGKTASGATTSYLQDVAASLPLVLAETTGGQTSRYVYGNDLILQLDPVGTPAYYHSDGLGSTRALSNTAGQRTDRYAYDAFGATRSHAGPSGQDFAFTGEQADDESGLVFLRARYYDPQIGRFLSFDRWPPSLWKTSDLNGYVYTANNPVTFIDPSGFDYIHEEYGLGAYLGPGVSLSYNRYQDLETGEVRTLWNFGFGIGAKLNAAAKWEVGTGEMPTTGAELNAEAELSAGASNSVRGKVDFASRTPSFGASAGGFSGELDGDRNTSTGYGVSMGAGAKLSVNYRFTKGQLGYWFHDRFVDPWLTERTRRQNLTPLGYSYLYGGGMGAPVSTGK